MQEPSFLRTAAMSVEFSMRAAAAAGGEVARATGLEPATSGVTGRHSNRLSYARAFPRDRRPKAAFLAMEARSYR